jgi:biotin carboxyl carrier protein
MLQYVQGRIAGRQFQLFTSACLRRIWGQLLHEQARKGINALERFADGEGNLDDFNEAIVEIKSPLIGTIYRAPRPDACPYVSVGSVVRTNSVVALIEALKLFNEIIAECSGMVVEVCLNNADIVEYNATLFRLIPTLPIEHPDGERQSQAALLRDIVGNPFHTLVFNPAWRTPEVMSIARSGYLERLLPAGLLDIVRLAVLADALEDAGCNDLVLLDHLRGPGPHVRGCWAVDLLLDKK